MHDPNNPSAFVADKAKRTSLQPARSYSIPGGPAARNLGEVEVKKLAEIERGGEHDRNAGR